MNKGEKLVKSLIIDYRKSLVPFNQDDLVNYLLYMSDKEFYSFLNTPDPELVGQKDYYGHEIDLSDKGDLFSPHSPYGHIFVRGEDGQSACIYCGALMSNFDPDFKIKANDSRKYKLVRSLVPVDDGIIRRPGIAESNFLRDFSPKILELVPELKDLSGERLQEILEDED